VSDELARQGHRLALVARREDRLESQARAYRDQGVEALVLPFDLAGPQAPEAIVEAVLSRFGRLDVLINNAGMGLPRFFGQSDPDALRTQLAVNLEAPILLTRHALPWLEETRGMVINVGSAVSVLASPVFGVYGTTKAGLAYFTDALRREVASRGIRVCLVEPGPVSTEFFEAVESRGDERPCLGTRPTWDGLYNPIRDRPPRIFEAHIDDAARRIVRLLDHPRRRLSFPRRFVWPWRVFGGLLRMVPGLTDLSMVEMVRRIEREESRATQTDPERSVPA
jgi:short-subunit dehydrogenase